MSCLRLQQNGLACHRPIKENGCCGYHKPYKNFKQINEEFFEYKKNRKRVEKIDLPLEAIKSVKDTDIALIVPYRDNILQNRATQLKTFIEYYYDFFPNVTIYIIEQSEGKKFNRGMLLNIGFKIAQKNKHSQYIFHDVDLLSPKEMKKIYTYKSDYPVHLAALWDKYQFSTFLGGAISFSEKAFETINGFPNCFFGWGGEDDAMYNRLAITKIPVMNPSTNKDIKIQEMKHPESQPSAVNEHKKQNVLEDLKNWKKDGLNSLDTCFEIISNKKYKHNNVRMIKVLV